MVAVATITAKGQTTIPQDVRAALHVAPGRGEIAGRKDMAGERP
ncbi:MAG: hypothetical protein AW10_02297 [Candidatus Accumulibacter appositus]|uniref:SpoVT-AbrB domain-containing protein n=1 Tax=Candidatus Accumulibacter appositus TaxID=1454003 RepID=A0A011QL19_9PROT|nr:MAG: hypothetical protein AW10_02297 [Candidatus Accumulibacter appositus]